MTMQANNFLLAIYLFQQYQPHLALDLPSLQLLKLQTK